MTTTQTRTAPSRRVPPAARQPGPVTLAIRGLRPNEAPTWEQRQREIDAEEREAMRALRRRIAAQIREDQNRIERCLVILDAMDGDADIEEDAGEQPEGVWPQGTEDDEDGADAEPTLCGVTVNALFATGSAMGADESEPSLGSLGGTADGADMPQTVWDQGGLKDHEAGAPSRTHGGADLYREPGAALIEAREQSRRLTKSQYGGGLRLIGRHY